LKEKYNLSDSSSDSDDNLAQPLQSIQVIASVAGFLKPQAITITDIDARITDLLMLL